VNFFVAALPTKYRFCAKYGGFVLSTRGSFISPTFSNKLFAFNFFKCFLPILGIYLKVSHITLSIYNLDAFALPEKLKRFDYRIFIVII
jgi:hypothetical protein